MRNEKIRDLVLAALFFAIGLVLPFVTMQIPEIGKMMLPMHIPVLLCGFVCGWKYGLPVGFLLPITRSLLFHFPPLYPNAVAMMFELAAYGFFAGFLYRLLIKRGMKKLPAVLLALIAAMIIGRLVWGAASYILYFLGGNGFTFEAFLAGAVLDAIPGIVIQIILIPAIMLALDKLKLIKDR